MKVKDCMCKDVCFVKPNCNVYDAARIMNENHIGCIPIVDNDKNVVGILTDRDIVLRSVACNKNAKETPVSEVMTTNVKTCACEDDLSYAEYEMSKNQVRRIPVVNDCDEVVGILTTGNLANKRIGNEHFSETLGNICDCKGDIKNCC